MAAKLLARVLPSPLTLRNGLDNIPLPNRREDGDTPGDLYRHYDIAGAGHATPDELWFAARSQDIVKGGVIVSAVVADRYRHRGDAV